MEEYETALPVTLPLINFSKEIDIPKNLLTQRVTEDTATISWDKVQALIDRYSARCTSADGDTKEVSIGRDKSSTTLTGLVPGKEYVIYVWAENGNQQSQKAKTKVVTGNLPDKRCPVHQLQADEHVLVNSSHPSIEAAYLLSSYALQG